MGGSGSGRHYGNGRQTVEGCLTLKAEKLARDGMIRMAPRQGSLVWTNVATGEKTASAGCTCTNRNGGWILTLLYTVTLMGEKHEVDLPIPLQITYPTFGGIRWWFTCPLSKHGIPCNRRVGRLHLPPSGIYFGCRHCYDLTYESCQQSHRYDGLYRRLAQSVGCTPDDVKAVLSRKR